MLPKFDSIFSLKSFYKIWPNIKTRDRYITPRGDITYEKIIIGSVIAKLNI